MPWCFRGVRAVRRLKIRPRSDLLIVAHFVIAIEPRISRRLETKAIIPYWDNEFGKK